MVTLINSLSAKQQIFATNVGRFLVWIPTNPGYAVTLGEAYRTGAQAQLNALGKGGRAVLATLLRNNGYPMLADAVTTLLGNGIGLTLHERRLAIDLNLFIRGEYQTDSGRYARLGTYWKGLNPLNRWGGDFNRPDGNHFSMEHGGIR